VVIALVLAVAAALPSITTSIIRRDYYFFDITLTSTSPGTTQVFWDLGRGYNENDSSRQPLKIEPKPVVYRYMMPMGDIKHLRFDPVDGVGIFNLSHAQIVDFHGKVIRTFPPADFKPFSDIARTEIHGDTLFVETKPGGNDPVFELTLHTPLHLASNPHIWLIEGLPVALPVFLFGLFLGCPLVANLLHKHAARLCNRLQQHPGTTIVLAAVIAVAVQCHPVIFQGRSFASPNNGALMLYGELPTLPGSQEYMYTNGMSSDTGALLFNHLYYPMMQRDALFKYHELPLWNRYSLGGMPMLGQGQSGLGDPLNFIPIFADGAAWAWDVRFLLARWLFAAAMAFTLWQLTRHLAAAVLVALCSAFIGFFTFRLNHPANFSVCYAPLILWAWTGLIHASTLRRQTGWLIALFIANAMVMASGTVKEAYMANVCMNLAGVSLLCLLPVARGQRWRIFGLATLTGGIFVLISAPGWISFLVALKHSWTVYDQPWALTLPPAQFIGFFDDIFYRQTNADESVVAPALNFVFLLGVLWWLVSPRLWRTDRAGLALALAGLLPLTLAFGIIPPAWIVKVPFIANIYHIGNTFSCSLMVIVVVLAGCGFRDAFERSRETGWGVRLGLVLAIVGGLLAAYFINTDGGFKKSPFFEGYIPALLLAFIVLPLAFRWFVRIGRPSPLYVAVALGLPLLLWRHCQYGETFFNAYAFVPGLRSDLHAPSRGVAFIDQQSHEPGRRVGWGNSLFPAYNIALRWEGTYGVDTLRSRYYHELALEFDMKRVWVWDWANKPEDAPRLVPVHDMLNVDYYISDHAVPAREFAGLKLIKQLDLDVYQSPTAWPRAFFTDRVVGYSTVADFAQLIKKGDGRPFAAVQDLDDRISLPSFAIAEPPLHLPPGASWEERTVRRATDYHLTSNNTTFVVDAPGPGLAVLTEAYYEYDFQVTLDGKPTEYFRVNHAFKGVAIPTAGRHEVTFAYWPLYTTPSLWLAAAGAALAAIALSLVFFWTRPAATP